MYIASIWNANQQPQTLECQSLAEAFAAVKLYYGFSLILVYIFDKNKTAYNKKRFVDVEKFMKFA